VNAVFEMVTDTNYTLEMRRMMVIILVKTPCEFLASHMMSNTIDTPSNATNLSKSQYLVALTIEENTLVLTDRND
jgi:hypothetical protein